MYRLIGHLAAHRALRRIRQFAARARREMVLHAPEQVHVGLAHDQQFGAQRSQEIPGLPISLFEQQRLFKHASIDTTPAPRFPDDLSAENSARAVISAKIPRRCSAIG